MFEINDYIIYGSDSVCRVVENDVKNISLKYGDRIYYKLEPLYENMSTIYTPVDNEKVAMRKVVTKEEALLIIESIPSFENYSLNDKLREGKYKQIMHDHDCRELITMLKTVYHIKKLRLSDNKNVIAVDKRNVKIIEDWISEEFSVSFGISRDEVKELVEKKIKESYNK